MEVCEQEVNANPIRDALRSLRHRKPTPTEMAPVYSELLIMDWGKKSSIRFNRNDPVEVAATRKRFDELHGAGYLSYKLNSATQGEVVGTLDPNVERTVMHSPVIGG